MKKIALILAIVMVFSVFAVACVDDSTTTSSSEDASSVEVSENEKSEVSKPAKVYETRTGVEVAEDAKETIISGGASYTTYSGKRPAEADEQYPDSYGTELTDGVTGVAVDNFYDQTLSGYTSSSLNIDVDLGKEFDTIHKFTVAYFSLPTAGISIPGAIYVYASIDGTNWEAINADGNDRTFDSMTKPSTQAGTVQVAEISVPEYIKAKYIRFSVNKSGAWIFLDEVSVIADVEGNEGNKEFVTEVNNAYQTLGAVAAPTDGNDVIRDYTKILVSKGKKYKVTGTVNDNFKDSGSMLTDGLTSGYYEGETWVGFNGGQDITVKVDLARNLKDIGAVEVSFFVNTTVKIYLPAAIKITAIDNKNNRTDLGILYGNTVVTNGNYTFSLPLQKTATARYLEITMYATDCNMHMVEEIAVYAYRDQEPDVLYPTPEIDTNVTEWGSDGSDEYQNLILGMDEQIIADSDPGQENYNNNTDVTSELLTDGKFATSTDIHNGKFFKFNGGGGRKVIYDLGHLSYVDKFTASFTNKEEWAVHNPDITTIYVSDDGQNWYVVGKMNLVGDGTDAIYKGELVAEKPLKARYVAFAFDVISWVGCDELEIYGKKTSAGATSPADAGLATKNLFTGKRMEPSEDLLGGSKDLCLLYHTTDTDAYKVEDLIPYLAYMDTEGNIKDVMFDSFLFLYNNTKFPSGGYPYEKSVKSDWEWTLNDLFTEGEHIMALEEAAGQVKQALGLAEDFTYKVTMTIYYPSTDTPNFGDVDGDGVSENFANYADRIKAIKWYIDEVEKRFAEANFKNIELVGYYWYHEEIVMKDSGSNDMINDTADLVHATGRDFYWIPWYCAPGFNQWSEYGFDVAVMQPNYVFDEESPYSKVVNCAKFTELYGMGIEMEICTDALRNKLFFKKYMQYLAGGIEFGYMNDAVNMYYQSTFIYRDAAKSDNLMARTIYDTTYHYIKGDMQYSPDKLENLNYNAKKNEVFTGKLEFDAEKLREFEVYLTADHGSVTMNEDGTFNFYPEKDYTGETKFSFVYSEYLGWSEPCEVVINIQ